MVQPPTVKKDAGDPSTMPFKTLSRIGVRYGSGTREKAAGYLSASRWAELPPHVGRVSLLFRKALPSIVQEASRAAGC